MTLFHNSSSAGISLKTDYLQNLAIRQVRNTTHSRYLSVQSYSELGCTIEILGQSTIYTANHKIKKIEEMKDSVTLVVTRKWKELVAFKKNGRR